MDVMTDNKLIIRRIWFASGITLLSEPLLIAAQHSHSLWGLFESITGSWLIAFTVIRNG